MTKTVEEVPVNIAVIGGGGVGETLAKAWARRGQQKPAVEECLAID